MTPPKNYHDAIHRLLTIERAVLNFQDGRTSPATLTEHLSAILNRKEEPCPKPKRSPTLYAD